MKSTRTNDFTRYLIVSASGAMAASSFWLIILIIVVLPPPRGPAPPLPETPTEIEARLVREGRFALAGGQGEWKAVSVEGQQAACLIAVRSTHQGDPPDRQRMLARLIWAQVDYVMEDNPLPNSTVAEAIALIDTSDYQAPPKKPRPKRPQADI